MLHTGDILGTIWQKKKKGKLIKIVERDSLIDPAWYWRSRCGAAGSTASLERWATGSIPGTVGSGSGIGRNCGSDLILGLRTPYATGQPKRKIKHVYY